MIEEIQITKTATCPTLSGGNTLTHEIGRMGQGTYCRIVGNTGSGLFCKDWVDLSKITDLLTHGSITSKTLQVLYQGKSSNSAGFLLAIIKAEGLVRLVEGTTFRYTAITTESSPKSAKKKAGAPL